LIGKVLILCLLFTTGLLMAAAQAPRTDKPLSNLRKKTVSITSDTLRLDSLSIIPNTLSIPGIPDSLYTIDFVNGRLTWKQRPPVDSITIQYRVFNTRLNAAVKRMDYDSVINFFIGKPYTPNFVGVGNPSGEFFNFGSINYNGSFGRGISFGNNQDAVVTSNLNLQISGYLADSIEIAAAITDNNIPIQPDGTTQQLNEFDRIFLQFKKKTWALSLGDIDIRQNQSYFLTFYKRLQGIAFETTAKLGPKTSNNTLVSGSIAKGKFTRNLVTALEGNQGPYRLQGANNEFFFVVLANTERVFIDGELMQRGEDADYVINYNTAEITFTPRQMINKDKRIVVEFEYADRNYLNSNLYLTNETNFNEKLKLRVGFFSNADAKSSPINQTLDAEQKNFLDTLGDNIGQAFYPNAVQDTFSVGKILYAKIDTVYNGGNDTSAIYVYSTDPAVAQYSLSFIYVGEKNGNYIPDLNGANGKVYRWVEPVGGVKQGNYEPAVFLVTPKKQQLMNLGVDYKLDKKTVINTEVAMSTYDVNTFSSRDKDNDKGYAARVLVTNTQPLGNPQKGLKLVTNLGYEFVQDKFKPLERLRNIEFTRDWGLPLLPNAPPVDETIITAGAQLSDNRNNTLRYQFTSYNRDNDFKGIRNSVTHTQSVKGWRFNNNFTLSTFDATNEKGHFLRPMIDISRQFARIANYIVGANYAVEHNEVRRKVSDSVADYSFSFTNFSLYLKSNPVKPNKWGITYFTRTNAYPLGTELATADRSQNLNVFAELLRSQKHQFRFTATYRTLEILNSSVTKQLPDESMIGRVEYQVNEWRGLVAGGILYELGAGQEQKRDFAFLEVPAGQGEYTWIDYNSDGIQQLNEFEIALFQDQARYIRIFTPTNEFVKANYNTINYSIGLFPKAVIDLEKAKGFARFVSRINLNSSLQLTKKEIARGAVQFNPFEAPLNDTSLITLNSAFVNTFAFNRVSPKWGFDVNNSRNTNKSLLTYGYETRKLDDWSLRMRWNISRRFALELIGRTGINQLTSSNVKFGNRNFKIDQQSVEPRITFTRGANFRLITGYKFSEKVNGQGSLERSNSHAINSEVKYNILQNTSITGKFTYNTITFTSQDAVPNLNTPSAYIMLDGLLPGKNFLWTLDLTKRLSNNLEMNIQYEGRKPGESRIIHTGRASVRAIL
jgi:hypothetical protein